MADTTVEHATPSGWVEQTPEETRRINQRILLALLGSWLLIGLLYVAVEGGDGAPADLTGQIYGGGDVATHDVALPEGPWVAVVTEHNGFDSPYLYVGVPGDDPSDGFRCQGLSNRRSGAEISPRLDPLLSYEVGVINGGHMVRVEVRGSSADYRVSWFPMPDTLFSNPPC